MAFVEQLGNDNWLVVCAVCCYTALVLCILYTSFNCFLPIPLLHFSLICVDNYTEWSAIPAYPCLMCSFNRGNIEGTHSSKMCV